MLRHNHTELNNNLNALPVQHKSLNGHASATSSNHITNTNLGERPLSALQRKFVLSMKTLFDILDPQRSGFIKFSDIEKGWQDDTCKGLPRGVLNSLRKVTPACGLLSFERFCAGLKLCLLKQQKEPLSPNSMSWETRIDRAANQTTAAPISMQNSGNAASRLLLKQSSPPSAPMLEIENPVPTSSWSHNLNPLICTTQSPLHKQRALSMPHLSPNTELETGAEIPPPRPLAPAAHCISSSSANAVVPPPKPPRASAASTSSVVTQHNNKAEIRHALQNWQMNALLSEMDAKSPDKHYKTPFAAPVFKYRGCADGGSSSATDSATTLLSPTTASKKTGGKRRESRRHTLQNGIDYNMLRRLKQLEEQHEVLMLALNAVEKTREWYLQQVNAVQQKMKHLRYVGTSSLHREPWSEIQQEHLNLQRTRVLEVNRNLAELVGAWEPSSYPMHLNLAIRTPTIAQNNSGMVQRNVQLDKFRQQQARHAGSDLSLSSETRIAMLEQEKQALLCELYDLQQRMGLTPRNRNGFHSVLSQSSPVCSSSSGGLGDADVVY